MDWLAVFVLVAGGVLIIAGFGMRDDAKKFAGSMVWPTTGGKITSSTIGSVSAENWTRYWVDIHYEYSVNGISHSGVKRVKRLKTGGGIVLGKKRRARKYVSAHPPGTPVLVYYDPNNPEIATDQPGERRGYVWWWVLGVVGVVLGLGRILDFFD